jgi:ureidoacrylate peracid hydrolase
MQGTEPKTRAYTCIEQQISALQSFHSEERTTMMSRSGTQSLRVTLEARPQPIEVTLSKTAVLVVDMQNDYGAVGGLFERNGIDISGIREIIAPTAHVLASARLAGVPVVYIKAAIRPDFSDLFEPGSPLRERWLAYGAGQAVQAPDGRRSRVLIRDTWNTDVIDELKPEPGDIEVYKHGYSGFHQTELDAVLKGLGVKYLIVTGCTTSVCVESTVRDAHSRDYYCILLEDCTAEPIGPSAAGYIGVRGGGTGRGSNYQSTLLLIQTIFGWVSNSELAIRALAAEPAAALTAAP